MIATVDVLQQQVNQAEEALARLQTDQTERRAILAKLEQERCDILVANRLDGKSSSRAESLASRIEKLRCSNADDAAVASRISETLEINRARLKSATRESACIEVLQSLERYEYETVNKFFELANALRDELDKCIARDLDFERQVGEKGLRPLVAGIKLGRALSERRGELVAAVLSDFVPTPFSRQWLALVKNSLGPASLGESIRQIRERIQAEQARAASAAGAAAA